MERTSYMESVMKTAYPQVAIEAVMGGFDGSFERAIAKVIETDYRANHSEAREIVDSIYSRDNFNLKEAFSKAAYLITSSPHYIIQKHHQ
jgi:hypothetical protein